MSTYNKIGEKEYNEIKKLCDKSTLTADEIAKLVGRSAGVIRRIRNGTYFETRERQKNYEKQKRQGISSWPPAIPYANKEPTAQPEPNPVEESSEVITPSEDYLMRKLELIRMSQVQTNYLLDLIIKKFDELLNELK